MTNNALLNLPFCAWVAFFTIINMIILGISYIKTTRSIRSGKRFEHTQRFGFDMILMFAFGGALLFVVSFVKKAIAIPSSFFLKLVMFALMIGLVFVITLGNIGISMFASNVAVNIAEKDLEHK